MCPRPSQHMPARAYPHVSRTPRWPIDRTNPARARVSPIEPTHDSPILLHDLSHSSHYSDPSFLVLQCSIISHAIVVKHSSCYNTQAFLVLQCSVIFWLLQCSVIPCCYRTQPFFDSYSARPLLIAIIFSHFSLIQYSTISHWYNA
jgi:hypothetical protein